MYDDMTERQKAEELVEKMKKWAPGGLHDAISAKQCAIICCDEILQIVDCSYDGDYRQEHGNFYREVKRIIEEEL
jgi:hypothetical protein